jgi:hypothetical protein
MSEFKVREVGVEEEKSVQEVEQELLDQHEAAQEEQPQEQPPAEAAPQEEQAAPELKEEDVLSFIKNRYNKEIGTVDELFKQQEANEPLPEDVSAFLKYKKETGRGFDDFIKLNRDYDKEDPNKLVFEYYKSNSEFLDDDDIQFEISEKFSFDESYDDEKEVRQKKLAFKKELAKAKEFFNKQKEQYMVPLESRGADVPEEEKELYNAFKSQAQKAGELQQEQMKRADFFKQKTNEVFNNDFKGFEFSVGDQKMSFKPGDPESLSKTHSDLSPFFQKFVDENGYIKDAAAYHKAMAVAMNPDSFAKYFYEKGKTDAVVDISKESKNIDMDGSKRVPETTSKQGFRVTVLDSEPSSKLKIKSKR